MKEDTEMKRKGIFSFSALESIPGFHLTVNPAFFLAGNQHPILGEGVRNNLPPSFPVILFWLENESPLPAEIFSSFAFRRDWQDFFWGGSRSRCCADRGQAPSPPPPSPE